MTKLYAFLCLILALLIINPSYAANNNNNPKFNDPDKPIMVNPDHDTFTITLAANPTTGYSWFLTKYDAQYIKPVSYRFIPPQKMVPGKGGTAVWTFKTTDRAFVVPIMTTISLIYAQPWSLPASTARDFTVVSSAQ